MVLIIVMMIATMLLIALSAVLPSVYQEGQRERENELVFRGLEYGKAVALFHRQFGRYPTSIKELLQTNGMRFLRKEYPDPMDPKGKWRFIHVNAAGVLLDSKNQPMVTNNPNPAGIGTGGSGLGGGNSSMGGSSFGNSSFGGSSFGSSSELILVWEHELGNRRNPGRLHRRRRRDQPPRIHSCLEQTPSLRRVGVPRNRHGNLRRLGGDARRRQQHPRRTEPPADVQSFREFWPESEFGFWTRPEFWIWISDQLASPALRFAPNLYFKLSNSGSNDLWRPQLEPSYHS
jgi:hypothetical protein